jgi:DNA-binding SARP family transcriptional activator
MEDGDLAGAERTLETVDADTAEPSVRSALRQTRLSLGWRTGRPEMVRSAVRALLDDAQTPAPLREIAQLFVDTDPDGTPQPIPAMARRLEQLSVTQVAAGLDFYSAVALHNASTAYLWAGLYDECLNAARRSLSAFAQLHLQATEAMSTHSVITLALLETGRDEEAQHHATASMEGGMEFADVPAAIAVAYFAIGRIDEAGDLLRRATALERQGRADLAGSENIAIAEASSLLGHSTARAVELLSTAPPQRLMDLGQSLERRVVLSHAYLAAGDISSAEEVARGALESARRIGARRTEVRLAVLLALARGDNESVATAVRQAQAASRLALAELADVLTQRLALADLCMNALEAAIDAHPRRWLPLLRQALGKGAPAGDNAAVLLDRHGELRDVAVLRAYARTYRGRGQNAALGLALARHRSPLLRIHDLGKVILEIGERSVAVSAMRRKPAALLLYLASRPSFTAHRDQVIDDLWPDADPASAINSLNQSLYFLRREIDPWYEDGVSPDYVEFAGDLVWLDADLVTSDATQFLSAAQRWTGGPVDELVEGLRTYSGHFAPEFEYEEWALSFRSKLRSKFLETASTAVTRMVRTGELEGARTVAMLALEVDDTAIDLERLLVWLQWRIGARSAAKAQYEHVVRVDQLEGLDPVPFLELVEGQPPLGTQ